ncbi:hypothetical protein CFter6_3563 [Collimonas fungivorans]|jgi:hypothetical protein|uniref:Uncharacterized protein n=1 Tax=Collimonas fungivorans TaxID=158899 RepID=A0A127PEG4_9BURK|nr:hypothetical protein [Collimonas fungivorans]AMO96196.1 hypothetical protein CFter6_3563 [Collimonas fungivorans]
MNKSNFRWIVAALVLGAGGIYAVFSVDDSIAQTGTQAALAAHAQGGSSAAAATTASPGLSAKAQDAVNINPFGK